MILSHSSSMKYLHWIKIALRFQAWYIFFDKGRLVCQELKWLLLEKYFSCKVKLHCFQLVHHRKRLKRWSLVWCICWNEWIISKFDELVLLLAPLLCIHEDCTFIVNLVSSFAKLIGQKLLFFLCLI